jgi:hypothetical protein
VAPLIPHWFVFALFAGQAPATAPSVEPVVVSVVVPAALAAVTSNPELSGIVWSKKRNRYLVVTDDSGLREDATAHQPLLLGMTEKGVLDPKPIAIRGVDRINDPESICAGPNGTYFLVTSHSPNRSNKTSHSRRQLLQLRDDGDALAVVGRLDLTAVKGSRSLLSLLGLPDEGRLDIEAVAFHDAALFIGFKSPLTADGAAVVARLASPVEAMRRGAIHPEDLTRFLAAPLCLDTGKQKVCEGISDMLFLPDGSLMVSANAPKGGPKDHGGALWHLPSPPDKRAPVLLRRFPDLKPEGLAYSPSGRSVAVVFDCDQAVPKWTEVSLPTR